MKFIYQNILFLPLPISSLNSHGLGHHVKHGAMGSWAELSFDLQGWHTFTFVHSNFLSQIWLQWVISCASAPSQLQLISKWESVGGVGTHRPNKVHFRKQSPNKVHLPIWMLALQEVKYMTEGMRELHKFQYLYLYIWNSFRLRVEVWCKALLN